MNKLPESFVYIDCVSTKQCVTRRFSTVKSWFQNRVRVYVFGEYEGCMYRNQTSYYAGSCSKVVWNKLIPKRFC